ncbi:MAG: hypothetical protein JO058_22075 [Alphaproteobacteria bacterium]|nr:hypothetical protein [Alphaproteobacteria bacterium]
MSWIYLVGAAVLALLLAGFAFILFRKKLDVAMSAGETDMTQFQLQQEPPKARRRWWRLTIERD